MALPTPYDNPMTRVYDALWDMAEANPTIREYIPENNRIKFSTAIGTKRSISSADTPELMLIPASTSAELQSTSSSSKITHVMTWFLTCGDFRVNDVFHQVYWELFQSMPDWQKTLCALTWGPTSQSFVKELRMLTSSIGVKEDNNRHIEGWAMEWPMEIDMYFTTKDLRL